MIRKIRFICNYVNRKNYHLEDLPNYKFYDLVSTAEEATFSIEINDRIFFSTEYFNVLEFLQQIAIWKENRGNMIYNCVDTDDNPLLSFIELDGAYEIRSTWQRFECKEKFLFSDLIVVEEILNTRDGSLC